MIEGMGCLQLVLFLLVKITAEELQCPVAEVAEVPVLWSPGW